MGLATSATGRECTDLLTRNQADPISARTAFLSKGAAAAAARAADDNKSSEQLLDQAQEADSAQPTYYGAAWVALGRVMLTSSALGACPD
jgi:endoglucanase